MICFDDDISGFLKYVSGFVDIDPAKACIDCRNTDRFREFMAYCKRVENNASAAMQRKRKKIS